MPEDYRTLNRANWDDRAPAHAASPDYEVRRFVEDPEHLSGVVRFDRPRLGGIAGLCAVHLQCHIGTDTLSLARLGARVTGLDLSSASLAEARRLAADAGAAPGRVEGFVEAEVYDAADVLPAGAFDLVYTGIGALNWLPSVERWAAVVAGLLAPGGRLHLREGHPVLWALDDERDDALLVLEHPYVERPEPMVWDDAETYVATDRPIAHTVTHEWNHGLGEIVTALLGQGLVLTALEEHDSVPYEALPGLMTDLGGGEHRLTDRPWRLPHTYTLQAERPAAG